MQQDHYEGECKQNGGTGGLICVIDAAVGTNVARSSITIPSEIWWYDSLDEGIVQMTAVKVTFRVGTLSMRYHQMLTPSQWRLLDDLPQVISVLMMAASPALHGMNRRLDQAV